MHVSDIRVAKESDVIPEFSVGVDDSDGLWTYFEAVNNVVLDCMISLESDDDYMADLVPEVGLYAIPLISSYC